VLSLKSRHRKADNVVVSAKFVFKVLIVLEKVQKVVNFDDFCHFTEW